MHKAAVVIVNQDEARRLTQRDDPHHQLEVLRSRLPGPAFVLMRGAEGAWWCRGDHREHVAATPVAAIDSTAAGDTFAGYFLAGVAAGHPPVESMRTASRAAAICVTRHGSLHSIPGRCEVDRAITD